MNEFIIPQELNIADRIGPFTFAQWGFIVTGGGVSFFLLNGNAVPIGVAIFLVPIIMGFSLYLALFKRYGMPIYEYVFAYLIFKLQPKEMIYSSENKIDIDFEDDEELGDLVLV